jgi:hypothetical protein
MLKSTPYPHFSAQPSKDFVTPGVGKLATNLYSFYVPLHGLSSPYEIKKVAGTADPEQVGSGNVSENIDSDNGEKIPLSNPNKRKLDDGIAESFMHPKIIKTKTILLKPDSKVVNVNPSKNNKDEKASIPVGQGKVKSPIHKFQFL